MSGVCGLCSQEIDAQAHRTCGVDLCDYCFNGDIAERMRERGFDLVNKDLRRVMAALRDAGSSGPPGRRFARIA